MTKGEFIEKLSGSLGTSKKTTAEFLNRTLEAIIETVKNGDSLSLTGFGKFHVSKRAARQGINPKTKEKIQIPATKIPLFRAGSDFKNSVNG